MVTESSFYGENGTELCLAPLTTEGDTCKIDNLFELSVLTYDKKNIGLKHTAT